jgi:alpha-1,6-mannosyltransferase
MTAPRKHIATYTLLGVSALVYLVLGYATPRENFTQLLLLMLLAFGLYAYITNQKLNVWHGIGAGIFFRLLLLFAIPALSEDYARFVWDGRLLLAGVSPYLYLPTELLQSSQPAIPGLTAELFAQLNSPQYYSVYPPVLQGVFWLAAALSPDSVFGSIVVMRVIILAAETGSILLLLRLLRRMALPDRYVHIYALNPLVILELTGNLHMEALLIFFLLLALYQLHYQRHLVAAVPFALAVGSKLLPLMFLPFVWRRLGLKRFLGFGLVLAITLLLLFLPLLSLDVLRNFWQSIDLYFQRFEFNASVYYLLRWLGYQVSGYNQIALIGPLLSVVALVAILSMAAVKKLGSVRRLAGYMAAALTVYLLLATTVHPWYLTTLVALTCLSNFRFAIIWSCLAIFSYSAYRTSAYTENLWLVALEYTLVGLWLVAELYLYRQQRKHANLPASR